VTQYLIGTGGWAYFKSPMGSSLKAYSKVFNFVEVNYTFYKYPDTRMVERWRRMVPSAFTFTVRCHQDLTHRIGLKPVEDAYAVFNQMIAFCRMLKSPFLHLETPAGYVFDEHGLNDARDFFSAVEPKGVRLAFEIRGEVTEKMVNLLQDFNIVHSIDLSRQQPVYRSDAIYSRLFGKGEHNIYQFDDEELTEIDNKIIKAEAKIAILSFHGIRMNRDALRFRQYKETGAFIPVTSFVGIDSLRAVLSEDARFPLTKAELIENQGWKVVDVASDKRVHLSELLSKLPEGSYNRLEDVVEALEAYL